MLTSFLSVFLLTGQAVPVVPVANQATPATLVNALAVKRDWTLDDNEFCKARAEANSRLGFPRTTGSKVKYVKTFSFRTRTSASLERSALEYTNAGFQVPFPWSEGQWLSRQYTAQMTPRYTYVLDLQDRPKEPNAYSTVASACVTVFGIR
ncbi:hypothetical protein [Deinococcus sp. Leaf326]|uniref:hypothetical protein n=1 Tax=Deinococcus sp. Leaf326 TaxID=1736338 RepID=UPI0006F49E54|nr:hypothetical protein [Deinococcus sp. Leaf326]KQR37705.1 hypothetical protein ASF71_14590 [Deinococcus sp. Leaf326]